MKKVLLLKNVMEDMDIGIYSTLDKAKDKLIKIFLILKLITMAYLKKKNKQ